MAWGRLERVVHDEWTTLLRINAESKRLNADADVVGIQSTVVGWFQKTPAPIVDRDLQDYETKPITVKELPLLTIESIIFSFVLINAILRYIE